VTRQLASTYRDWQKTRQPRHRRPLIIPPSRYQKCAGPSIIRLPVLQAIKFTVTRQLLNFYKICTATRKMPAESFCHPASIKNWLSRHCCLLINTNRDKLLTFIKLVPRNTTWPIFYARPVALQMVFNYNVSA
jgi:hypothetical protein